MRKHKAAKLMLLACAFTSLLGIGSASAASPNISRSYDSTTAITSGSLVSLLSGSSSSVGLANTGNAQRLVGVAVQSNQSLLALNPTNGKVQVATSGTVDTLVSTVNGNISVGQYIAVSPFNGVGMKAESGDRVIGVTTTSFNPGTPGATREEIQDTSGNTHNLTVGFIKLNIGVETLSRSNFSIQGLQQFAESLTGRTISVIRLVISTIVAFVAILSIVALIYASIYGSIISIGRNPLAKLAVFRTLTSVIGMVTLIAGVAAVTVYLLIY